MASSFNLIRDSRVFFTTNVNSFGVVNSTGFLNGAYGTGNTWEIQVQDGFSFSQNTTTETVTLNEAGDTPNRGQRNFNTALEAVDFSFSTYIRPRNAGSVIDAEEGVLWNAMFSAAPIPAISLSGVAHTASSGVFSCTSNSTLAVGNIVTVSGSNTTPISFAGVATAVGSSGVFTCVSNSSLAVGGTVTFSGTNTGTGVIANGTYYITATTGPTNFTLSLTSGGAAISTPTTGTIIGQTALYVAPGGVTGLANGTYYITATTGPTNFSLSTTLGGAVITGVVGTSVTGLTFTHTVTAGINAWQPRVSSAVCSLLNSGKHQLQQFGLVIVLGGTTFVIDNCVMDSATIDFGLDAIASIAWAGKGSSLRQLSNSPILTNNTTTGVVTFAPPTSALSFTGVATAVNASGVFTCVSNSSLAVGGTVTFSGTNTTPISFTGISPAVNGAGVFTCVSNSSLAVGNTVTFSGTNTGTGVVANATYYITATTGPTNFTLSSTLGGAAITTTLGTIIGQTAVMTGSGVVTNGTYYITATTGPTNFTLSSTLGGAAITTTAGTLIGQTVVHTLPGSLTGTSNWKNISAPYLANKLSTVVLDTGIGTGGTAYTVAITGGNLTFANNVSYLTPANLGVVNTPIVYFTGTRAISGTMNAYLRTGTLQTAGLLKSLLEGSSTTVDPAFYMKLSIGGNPTALCRVDIEMPAVMLTIPTVATEQVVSTTISFTAQGSASSAFDIEQLNEATITYIA